MNEEETKKQGKAKESVEKLASLAFRDGFNTALIQLESFLIQTYANKILGISDPEKIVALPNEEITKVLDTQVQLGVFLEALNKTRNAVTMIMQAKSKPKENKPANQLDGGLIMP